MFESSYKLPSVYSFYSGNLPVNMSEINFRFSQYDLVHYEDSLNNKDVILIGTSDNNDPYLAGENSPVMHYRIIPGFISYHYLNLEYNNSDIEAKQGSVIKIPVTIKNTSIHEIVLSNNPDLVPKITSEISGITRIESYKTISTFSIKKSLLPHDTIICNYEVMMPAIKGKYHLRLYISFGIDNLRSVIGKAIKLKID